MRGKNLMQANKQKMEIRNGQKLLTCNSHKRKPKD